MGHPTFSFRLLTPADLPLLHGWLQRPHVARWWVDRMSLADLEADYFSDPEDTTRACIAWCSGQPVGFIQAYVVMDSDDGWWPEETDPGAWGIDQFLADGAGLGRGLGSAMVHAFVGQLFAEPSVTKVQTDPSPDNARAIRAYQRAGFVPMRNVVTPDGAALLMLCDRTSWAAAQPNIVVPAS
jgi:RimJ/RimL family protein N-acetyltransferase